MEEYEIKWQQKWEEQKLYDAEPDDRKKFFVTFPYPYVNGSLHMGHAFTGSRCDAFARYKRMRGCNVLFPFAFHATGEPIVGASKRVKAGEEKQWKQYRGEGLSNEEIKSFEDPRNIVTHYRALSTELAKQMGFGVDWRRSFTTIDPQYNKFIEWQYLRLKEMGYIVQGTHPVIYCSKCDSPTGDHDRLRGEGVSPVEFVLLKFRAGDSYLMPGTLRPETVFGVTNMWVHPNATYVKARVGSEKWIISKDTVEKLRNQLTDVEVLEEFPGKELIGKTSTNPLTGSEVMNLPAAFVDPCGVTGVVMSVPAHAPLDYLALKDIQDNPELIAGYGIDPVLLRKITPISLIRVDGMGEFPAIEVSRELGVSDQNDPKAEEATKLVYKKEFHTGVLKDNTGKYAGMPVRDCKEKLTDEFIAGGRADKMWEPEDFVQCRCTNRCIVKILENQWFLKYGDESWKEKARAALKKLVLYPEDYRAQMEYSIEWVQDKACTRKSGMGTRLPWDKEWLIETLSDSTAYMAYYILAKYIYSEGISADQLTPDFFDHVLGGNGSAEEVAVKTGINKELLLQMRSDFGYWYGVDFRNSGKDLISNHLIFFIFHHVALWDDEKKWPHGIGLNGFLTSDGEKMSKSKGNVVILSDVLRKYGPDAIRLNLLYAAEGTADPDWQSRQAEAMRGWIKKFMELAPIQSAERELSPIDKWMLSKTQRRVSVATDAYEATAFRTAISQGFFELMNDYKWYRQRCEGNAIVDRYVVGVLAKILAPVMPHASEEVWSKLGNEGSIFNASWPAVEEDGVDRVAELAEGVVRTTSEDVQSIIELTKSAPKRVFVYVSPEWKRVAWHLAKQAGDAKQVIPDIMADDSVKSQGKAAASYGQWLAKNLHVLGDVISQEEESSALQNAVGFFSKSFGSEFVVLPADKAEYDPAGKAGKALPMKPAIYVE
ncbi:MAG: leucine--tRNA ligase [Candidatus Diapherotrites archaeon]|nr:leucine--tRNA ligase [Candidatus Diapherotrites archaeon]